MPLVKVKPERLYREGEKVFTLLTRSMGGHFFNLPKSKVTKTINEDGTLTFDVPQWLYDKEIWYFERLKTL